MATASPSTFGNAPSGGVEDPFDDTAGDALDEYGTWFPEVEITEDPQVIRAHIEALPELPSVSLSQFTEIAFRMPNPDGQLGYEPFSFEGRRHMRRPYDTSAKRILLLAARQTEKTTLLGNRAIAYSCLVPGFRTLYVSPTSTQTKTFSNDRLKEPIETSEVLRAFTTTMLSQNVFEKQFVNWSKITLRNAFLNADRVRGLPAWLLLLDEFQDLLSSNIPVIEQCTSHAPEQWKQFCYTGTPKSLDNNIEYYRSGYTQGRAMSTQGEWVVPCDACGVSSGPAKTRYWNILGERNISKKFLVCERCGNQIDPQHPDAQWARMVEDGIFESYRIPQLMVPWKSWQEILLDYERYPRDKFYNEVLGISYDSGMRPLNQAQVKACCDPQVTMHPDVLAKYKPSAWQNPVYAGIDYGTGEGSYTVLTLGTYVNNKFRIIYAHRFTGQELEPPVQMAIIIDMLKEWGVLIIGADYGGGFDRNDTLTREFGPHRLAKFQYMARAKRKVEYDIRLRRYKVFRTEVMSDIFNAIKRQQIVFPRWEEFREPYATDMCNIYAEYSETLRMIRYDNRADRPDDTFHSVLYCFLASMIRQPRRDIIAPLREDQNQGPGSTAYPGTVWQG